MGRARSRVAIRKQNIFKHTSDHTHTHTHRHACACRKREREGPVSPEIPWFCQPSSFTFAVLPHRHTGTVQSFWVFQLLDTRICSWAFCPFSIYFLFYLALTMWLVTGLLPYAVLLILVILLHSLPTPSALDPSTFAPFYTNARWRKIPIMSWFQLETYIAPSPVPCAAPTTFSTLL